MLDIWKTVGELSASFIAARRPLMWKTPQTYGLINFDGICHLSCVHIKVILQVFQMSAYYFVLWIISYCRM